MIRCNKTGARTVCANVFRFLDGPRTSNPNALGRFWNLHFEINFKISRKLIYQLNWNFVCFPFSNSRIHGTVLVIKFCQLIWILKILQNSFLVSFNTVTNWLLRSMKVHYRLTINQPLVPIINKVYPTLRVRTKLPQIHFNIILACSPRSH